LDSDGDDDILNERLFDDVVEGDNDGYEGVGREVTLYELLVLGEGESLDLIAVTIHTTPDETTLPSVVNVMREEDEDVNVNGDNVPAFSKRCELELSNTLNTSYPASVEKLRICINK
jgi:hypothetical protein